MSEMQTPEQFFATRPPVNAELYTALMTALAPLGPVTVETKQTCLHLCHGAAFAGIHPRKDHLRLEVVTDYPLEHPRVVKTDKLSARRYHHAFKLAAPTDIDTELLGWLGDAYRLKG